MRRGRLIVLGGAAILLLLSQQAAFGIPAFARREGVKCTMCHFRLPELNEDGHAYLRRGLREEPPRPGQERIPADRPRPLGLPLQMEWTNYLTVMGHHMAVAQREARLALEGGVADLWVGGPLDLRWSGLANPAVNVDEGGIDVEQAYGQYISRWQERFFSVRAGQLLPFAILFNQGGPSMALSAPLALAEPAATGNPWTPAALVKGVEAGYVDLARWNAYAGIVQPHLEEDGGLLPGTPPGAATAAAERTAVYGSLQYLFTEEGNSLTLYGYSGQATLAPDDRERGFHRLGVFGSAYLPATKGTAGFLWGSDDDAAGASLDNSGFFALLERLLDDRWAAFARYDWFRRDLADGARQTAQGPVLGVSWWAETQVRLTVEGRLVDVAEGRQQRRLAGEFMWAF